MSTLDDRIALKVLVVEDCSTNRSMLRTFLSKLGHHVTVAEDGLRAIQVYQAEQPDLVLMDVMMPNMNGHEATRAIKQLAGDVWVPIIMVSALVTPEYLVQGLDAGADDYLPKPLNFRVLDAKMRAFERTLALQRRIGDTLRRTRAITDNVVDSIITIDDAGVIKSCNPATERLFGYREKEMIDCSVALLVSTPSNSPQCTSPMAAMEEFCLMGRQREVVGRRKDGSLFPLELGMSKLLLDGRQTYIAILHDTSERREAERRLRENAERLQRYHDAAEEENALARKIMARQLNRGGQDIHCITSGVEAAANFSGDVTTAAHSAEGRIYAMLADATGHGLAAAISIMPAIPIFFTMAERNLPLSLMVTEMNATLRRTMPAGRFVAAVLICIDFEQRCIEVWNGGMPDCLWLAPNGATVQRFASAHLPLGIISSEELGVFPETFTWRDAGQLVLCSDGVVEAESPSGVPLGPERMAQILRDFPPSARYAALRDAVRQHIGNQAAHDDASIMIIDCAEYRPEQLFTQ